MKKSFLFLILFSLMTACISQKEMMNSWINSTKHDLIMSWGPPARTASDGGTGEILIYAREGHYPGINGQGAYTYWDYKYMYVDNSGKIYHWRANTERVPPTQIDINIYNKN